MSALMMGVMVGAVAAISGGGLVNLLISLVILGLIWWVVTWGMGRMPIPEPFKTIIWVVLILIVVVYLVNVLLSLGGHGFINW